MLTVMCFSFVLDYDFSQSGNSWSLEICDIDAAQAGTYSATATNTGGSVSCHYLLFETLYLLDH